MEGSAASAHASVGELDGCAEHMSNKSVQGSHRGAAEASTEDARFAVTSFETHFDGCNRFFNALGVVCQTCDL